MKSRKPLPVNSSSRSSYRSLIGYPVMTVTRPGSCESVGGGEILRAER
jgi:hypothetical protein